MNMDQFVNLIFFIIGLAIGLFQLYVGQRQFESQQREKMDEIRNTLTDIQAKLAILQELSSQRTFDVQDKLISLATREEALTEVTEATGNKIHKLIVSELQRAGLTDAVARTKVLEKKVTQALENSATSLVEIATSNPIVFTPREAQILEEYLKGLTISEIAKRLDISSSTSMNLLSRIYQKAGVKSRSELMARLNLSSDKNSTNPD